MTARNLISNSDINTEYIKSMKSSPQTEYQYTGYAPEPENGYKQPDTNAKTKEEEQEATSKLPEKEESEIKSEPKQEQQSEIRIIIAAEGFTPQMMSLESLRFSGVIPKDWGLLQKPITTPNITEFNFVNGVNIRAESNTISISETVTNKEIDEILSPKIIAEYVSRLPFADYLGIAFCPRIVVPFARNPEDVRYNIAEKLIANGSWKDIGQELIQAEIHFLYLLEHCTLKMSVSEASLMVQPGNESISAILYGGTFNYELNNRSSSEDILTRVLQALNFWRKDWETFQEIVNEKFLSDRDSNAFVPETSLFPL